MKYFLTIMLFHWILLFMTSCGGKNAMDDDNKAPTGEFKIVDTNDTIISIEMYNSILESYSQTNNIKPSLGSQDSSWNKFKNELMKKFSVCDTCKDWEMDSLKFEIQDKNPVVVITPENTDYWSKVSAIAACLALILSIGALLFSIGSFKSVRKAEITKEFLSMNSFDIENPIVEWIYLTDYEVKKNMDTMQYIDVVTLFGGTMVLDVIKLTENRQQNVLNAEQTRIFNHINGHRSDFEQIMRSYCYKYLNLFDLVNQEYKIMRWWRGLKRVRRIADNNPKRWLFWWWMERTFPRIRERREWIRFFGNNFKYVDPDVQASGVSDNNGKKKVNAQIAASWKPPTKAYLIIDDILNRSVVKRTYSNRFIRYANKLMLNKDTTPF